MNSSAETIHATKGQVICRNTDWVDISRFLLLNYLLHAATVGSSPGSGWFIKARTAFIAIFMPVLGTIVAIPAIYRAARFERGPLQVALKARALCMVQPASEDGDYRERISPEATVINGQHPGKECTLLNWVRSLRNKPSGSPAGEQQSTPSPYLVIVPPSFVVEPLIKKEDPAHTLEISSNYSIIKVVAAITQICLGSFQLFKSSKQQLQDFGYAAYPLTIIPYTLMSLINLCAALFEPEYPAMLLVKYGGPERPNTSGAQQEEIEIGLQTTQEELELEISGAVGIVYGDFRDARKMPCFRGKPCIGWLPPILATVLMASSLCIPYLLIWVLTRFKPVPNPYIYPYSLGPTPRSSRIPDAWVVIWLVFCQVYNLIAFWAKVGSLNIKRKRTAKLYKICYYAYLVTGVCGSTLGFLAVVKLMGSSEICTII